ncbi:MAG: ribosome biogenesis GTP-binding protein YihA/YsxC [Desulfurivibrionaceae bacterium]
MAASFSASAFLGKSCRVEFITSVFNASQLPAPDYPEIAFAGRSNVGKSSLINKLINRRGLVKVSAQPGKTQSLNFFLVEESIYLVDLPGYGFAKVPRKVKNDWQGLITSYLEKRDNLRCVVVIVDMRHNAKEQDLELVAWLRMMELPLLLVYTKADKLSGNQRGKLAAALDREFGANRAERVIFSAKTGEGMDELLAGLDRYLDIS